MDFESAIKTNKNDSNHGSRKPEEKLWKKLNNFGLDDKAN